MRPTRHNSLLLVQKSGEQKITKKTGGTKKQNDQEELILYDMEPKVFLSARPGEQVALIESAKNNNGTVSRFESIVAPGSTVPPHYHMAFEEHFEVITGELTVWVNNKKLVLAAGQKFEIKKNVKHRWKNESKAETRFIGSVLPGNVAFESLLPIFVGLKKDGQLGKSGMPKSMAVLAYMCMISDLRFTGAMSLMWPVMRWLYSRAEKKGVYKKMIEKYSN